MKIVFLFSGIAPYMNALLNRLVEKGAEIITVIPAGKSSQLGKGVKVIEGRETVYRIIVSEEKKSITGKHQFPALPSIIEQEKPGILVAGWPYYLQFITHRGLRKSLRRNGVRFVIREIPFQVPPFGEAGTFFKQYPMYDEDMNQLSKGVPFYVRQWLTMLARRYCYSRADGALAYSSLGETIMPTYGIGRDNVFVTFNTGDSEALLRERERLQQEPPILPANSHRIIHIGRLVKWKRVDLLLDAFVKIADEFPDAELVIVGDGPERERLRRRAEELGVDQHVLFTGGVYDTKTIGAYLNASSLYVLAGMGGLSINDAMAYGLPVICSVCDGTEHDLISNNINGFIFREQDADDLSDKIAALLRDPVLRERMGKASLEVIEKKINLESVSTRYIEAFKKIMS